MFYFFSSQKWRNGRIVVETYKPLVERTRTNVLYLQWEYFSKIHQVCQFRSEIEYAQHVGEYMYMIGTCRAKSPKVLLLNQHHLNLSHPEQRLNQIHLRNYLIPVHRGNHHSQVLFESFFHQLTSGHKMFLVDLKPDQYLITDQLWLPVVSAKVELKKVERATQAQLHQRTMIVITSPMMEMSQIQSLNEMITQRRVRIRTHHLSVGQREKPPALMNIASFAVQDLESEHWRQFLRSVEWTQWFSTESLSLMGPDAVKGPSKKCGKEFPLNKIHLFLPNMKMQ